MTNYAAQDNTRIIQRDKLEPNMAQKIAQKTKQNKKKIRNTQMHIIVKQVICEIVN